MGGCRRTKGLVRDAGSQPPVLKGEERPSPYYSFQPPHFGTGEFFMSGKSCFSARRLAADAVLIALYFALSFLSVKAWVIEISTKMLPVILAALLFGPMDGFLVGLLGAFLEQVLSTYGLTPTTVLWLLPAAACGLLMGLFRRKLGSSDWKLRLVLFFAVGVVCSLLNTVAFYVDSKLFHYYTYELIVIDGIWRLLKDAVFTPVLGFLALEIAKKLRQAGLARQEGAQ